MTERPRDDDSLPLSGGRPVNDDVRGELEFHFQQRIADLMASGHSRERATTEARASFGDRAAVEAECREIEQRRRATKRRADRLGALWQDLRLGARVLRKSPGFTLSAILTLALGIGANAAIFSIVNGVILQPLAYEHADRLVTVRERHANGGSAHFPWPNFVDVEAQSHSFDGLAAYGSADNTVLVNGSARQTTAGVFSAGFFDVFHVRPVLGRLPTAQDQMAGANPVAVVSYAFWRDVLGAPSSLDTVHITLSQSTAVIGVLPVGFDFPEANQVWLTIPPERVANSPSRTGHNWEVIGRLKGGVTVEDAARDLDGVLARLSPLYAPDFDATGAEITPLKTAITGSLRTPLYLLLAASAVLLLGACVNIASAMLARGTARAGEFAVRSALGATRMRLIRQLCTESALLAALGCGCGLMLASAILKALPLFAPPVLHVERVRIDLWVQAFALAVAVATIMLFGLFPALRLARGEDSLTLREGTRGTAGAKGMRAWNVLVGAEVTLAIVLLSGSALLIRSFAFVMESRLGFDAANVYIAQVDLPAFHYADTAIAVHQFHERALDRLRHVPGVQSAGFAMVLPLGGGPSGAMVVEGKPFLPTGSYTGHAEYRIVGGDFFGAMGIPVIEGRAFRDGDDNAAAPVVVVSESFAKQEWPANDPLGKRVKVYGMDRGSDDEAWATVIGVVGDVRNSSLTAPFRATYYFDHRTRPASRTRQAMYVVKSTLSPAAIASVIRREIRPSIAKCPLKSAR